MVSREDLYDLVWSKPMTEVAAQFGVSGSYMARVCTALGVPRPDRGYWAKQAVGKAPPRKPLPAALPGDPVTWSKGDLLPEPAPPPVATARRAKRARAQPAAEHHLIRGAKAHFAAGRPVDEGAYLKPYKKLLVDVTASKACLDRALAFANQLFAALEAAGHRVMLAPAGESLRRGAIDECEAPQPRRDDYRPGPWSPQRPTVVHIGALALGLAVIEMSEEVVLRYVHGTYIRDADYVPPKRYRLGGDPTWTTTRDLPSGRLRLVAYSPYGRVTWSRIWQETTTTRLEPQVPDIVAALEAAVPMLTERLAEAKRQAEIAHQEWLAAQDRRRREEDRRRVRQSIAESKTHLAEAIRAWAEVMAVERFLRGVEERARVLPEDEQREVLARLALAREFLGTQDPLDFFRVWKTPSERYQPVYGPIEDE